MSSNIVVEWLRSLHLGQYAESFIDNGYDDLEICKQVGDPDLDAIGVFNPSHRSRLLQSVRTLREEGAASVYFTLEETAAVHEDCQCDNSSARSSRTSSGHQGSSDKEQQQGGQRCGTGSSPASSSAGSGQEVGKYLDEYEEGKAELVKIPRLQLKLLLKDKLGQDGIRLSCQPYSTSSGERGYLEGLASRYADLFNTHYGDVLEHLEDLRRREWEDMSPRIRVLVGTTPGTPPSEAYSPVTSGPVGVIGGQHTPQGHHGLTTSHSQPIYVPGKYSPSSCLSDKEEDEIYGFGYGVYGKQMLQRHQQHKMIISPQVNYQSCLSPRSAYFYEFPPSGQSGGQQTNKKKMTTFSRFLRGLKTGHRKEKHCGSSPRHTQSSARILQAGRVGTPDSVPESLLPSIVDPRDYDRLRFMQMNGGTGNSFEETIHRLKVQEVLKKRERFHKEHEEILRDIRQGLLQIGREGVGPALPGDDTYMYDDDARCSGIGPHWYDEPPYESDPEDFLMGTNTGQPVPLSTIQNGRVCFTLDLRSEPRGEGVISLRTAGDISIPRDPSINGSGSWLHHTRGIGLTGGSALTPRGSARRGLLVAQSGPYPATIIPLGGGGGSHMRDTRGDDYAGSDVQSIGSRLSSMSIDTSRSEQLEGHHSIALPAYLSAHGSKGRSFRKLVAYASRSSASEEGLSQSQSSDYEDQEDLESVQQPKPTHSAGESGGRTGGVSLVGRMRGLRQDVQKKISRLRASGPNPPPPAPAPAGPEGSERRGDAFPSTSSVESLPSGSGSSTQALVPAAGSNHSSLSAEDHDLSPISVPATTAVIGPVIGKARALVDYTPSPYDKDALRFKKGDVIDVVAKNASGLWRGVLHSRVGNFKFINVELLSDKMCQRVTGGHHHSGRKYSGRRCGSSARGRPHSVEELLQRMNLEEHISVFVLNGYEDLELFKDLEGEDLDYLGISNPDHRAKILTAVELLHDYDSPDSPEDTDGDGPVSSSEDEDDDDAGSVSQHSECSASQQQHPLDASKSSFQRLQFPRDSGCYDSSITAMKEYLHTRHHHRLHKKPVPVGSALQHHHHRSCRSSSSKCSKEGRDQVKEGCMGVLRPQGDCTMRTCIDSREVPNNLDSGLVTSLQHPLLQQISSGSGSGVGVGTVEGNEVRYKGSAGNVQGVMTDVDLGKQGLVHKTSVPQLQNFLPNIPVTSSSVTVSPITHLPMADFTGIMGGGRSLISASSISASISSSSPVRTCAGNSFSTEYKSDSYVVARGKRVTVESCRKAGSPSASSPVGSLRCSTKQQVPLDSPSSRRSPSNPFNAVTTNTSVIDVSPQVAASQSPCSVAGSGTVIASEDSCETNTKLTMVKYVVGGSSDLGLGCESGNVMGIGRGGCCLSEKSSDSGVSSSSLSSANPKDNCGRKEGRALVANNAGQPAMESPTRGFVNYGSCIMSNHRSSPTTNTSKGLVLQGPDTSSYQ